MHQPPPEARSYEDYTAASGDADVQYEMTTVDGSGSGMLLLMITVMTVMV